MMPFTPDQVASMQAVRAAGVMTSAQVQAVGGAAWTITRASGSGIEAAPSETTLGPIAARVVSPAPAVPSTGAGPVFLGRDRWTLYALVVGLMGLGLEVNDLITSVADPSLRFRVATVDTNDNPLYITAELDEA